MLFRKFLNKIDDHNQLSISKCTYNDFISKCKTLEIQQRLPYFDGLFFDSVKMVIEMNIIDTSTIQRNLSIGYARSARLIDFLEEIGIIGPSRGSRDREIFCNDYENALILIESYLQSRPFTEIVDSKNLCNLNDPLSVEEMDGLRFEHYCSKLLLVNGFQKADVTQASNDYGVDIIAVKDQIRYAIQCKYYQSSIGNSAIQEVSAGRDYYDCHIGVVMTNSIFTKNAIELAKKNKILLWDKDILNQMKETNS